MTCDSHSKLAAQGYLHMREARRIAQWSKRTDALTRAFAMLCGLFLATLLVVGILRFSSSQHASEASSLTAFVNHAERIQGAAESDYDLLRAARCKAKPSLCKD